MRTLLLELRPGALEKQSLAELLHQLVRGLLGRTRLPVNLSVDDDCSMPPDVQTALYRITQEALNNIVKHARASQVQVSLECEPGLVKLLISDDGVGFNPQSVTSNRLGLDIMPERAHAIGAVFEIDSQPDRGTHINVLWQDQQEGEKNG
jgi:signal transduction histidine kinase